jgi:hypothetical protein
MVLQPDRHVVLSLYTHAILQVIEVAIWLADLVMARYYARCIPCTPYHTSSLSRAHWVHKLITGHPECIWNELGVYQSTFTLLVKALQMLGL